MSSAETAKDILARLQEIDELITMYKKQVEQELLDLSEYDKFDQDALHFMEHVNLNAPESAKLMKKWSHIRAQRRIAKDNIYLAQELQPKFLTLQKGIADIQLRSPNRKYAIRTEEMHDFAQPFYEKKRLNADVFRPLSAVEEPQDEPMDEPVVQDGEVTPAPKVHVVLGKKGWELKLNNEVIFKNKKLSVVVDEIYLHSYNIQVDKAHKKVVDALLQKKQAEEAPLF